jgi:hypothetical protein
MSERPPRERVESDAPLLPRAAAAGVASQTLPATESSFGFVAPALSGPARPRHHVVLKKRLCHGHNIVNKKGHNLRRTGLATTALPLEHLLRPGQ